MISLCVCVCKLAICIRKRDTTIRHCHLTSQFESCHRNAIRQNPEIDPVVIGCEYWNQQMLHEEKKIEKMWCFGPCLLQDSADCLHTFTYRMIKDWCSTYVKTSKDMHSLQKLKICHLVGGFNHLEKYESQWEGLSHILWKIKAMFQTTNQSLMFIVWKTNVATRLHMVTMSEFIP